MGEKPGEDDGIGVRGCVSGEGRSVRLIHPVLLRVEQGATQG